MNQSAKQIKLLMVNSEREFLETAAHSLNQRGFNIQLANDGITALQMLRQDFFDVVVLDVKISDIDSLEVLQKIKEDFPAVEVILLTGYPSVETAFRGIKLGASEYIIKPAKESSLASIIQRVYASHRENINSRNREKSNL